MTALVSLAPLSTSRAQEEEPAPTLAAAEEAMVNIEHERAREIAEGALITGGHDVAETARLHEIVGTSSVIMNEPERGYTAYLRVVGLVPEREMDRSLSPALRTPFLRARGWWASNGARLGARLTVGDPGQSRPLRFIVSISNPLDLSSTLRLHLRPQDADEIDVSREVDSRVVIEGDQLEADRGAVERAPEFDYWMELLDEHENVLWRGGSAAEPLRVANPRIAALESSTTTDIGGSEVWQEWWFWGIIVLAVGAAATGVGLGVALSGGLNGVSGVSFP